MIPIYMYRFLREWRKAYRELKLNEFNDNLYAWLETGETYDEQESL